MVLITLIIGTVAQVPLTNSLQERSTFLKSWRTNWVCGSSFWGSGRSLQTRLSGVVPLHKPKKHFLFGHAILDRRVMAETYADLSTRRQKESERLTALHGKCPKADNDFPFTGVLLSDGIKYCVDQFDLIRPFREENLKPANYKLTIGDQYAVEGK